MERHESGAHAARHQPLSLEQATSLLLEECRMILPGVQALFGFQLVAVFDNAFHTDLSAGEQRAHLVAILCIVSAVALVLAPAAVHRMREPMSVSAGFVRLCSRLVMLALLPLAAGTTIDVYLVADAITHSTALSSLSGAFSAAVFVLFWTLIPLRARL